MGYCKKTTRRVHNTLALYFFLKKQTNPHIKKSLKASNNVYVMQGPHPILVPNPINRQHQLCIVVGFAQYSMASTRSLRTYDDLGKDNPTLWYQESSIIACIGGGAPFLSQRPASLCFLDELQFGCHFSQAAFVLMQQHAWSIPVAPFPVNRLGPDDNNSNL